MSNESIQALPKGYQLKEYRIEEVLGAGGFGITYKAYDTTLGGMVAIKEYFPHNLAVREKNSTVLVKSKKDEAVYQWGLDRFFKEAQCLFAFKHTNIVRVFRSFRAHQTAYFVMDYEEGASLASLLEKPSIAKGMDEATLLRIIKALIAGLKVVHHGGILHRDIKPGNIYIRRSDESPVLLDFGAAREAVVQKSQNQAVNQKSLNITAIIAPGYSPHEQYLSDRKSQGPWTDIYALSATTYRLIGGKLIEANQRTTAVFMERKRDPLISAEEMGKGRYSIGLLKAIDAGLKLREEERPQNVEDWEAMLPRDSVIIPPKPPIIKKRKWPVVAMIVGGLGIFSLVGGLMMSNSDQKAMPKPKVERITKLIVMTTPAHAKVRILNIRARYQAGMMLKAGRYEIEVSASGYQSKREWVDVQGKMRWQVNLEKEQIREKIWTESTTGMKFVWVPKGSFMMGGNQYDDEKPRHEVILDGFWMGQTEVTNTQYRQYKSNHNSKAYKKHSLNGAKQPVVVVSWKEAKDYAKWLSNRSGKKIGLPTEAQWEYACRAGTQTKYYWGNEVDDAYLNFADKNIDLEWADKNRNDGHTVAAPVGNYKPNKWGLYDMSGNVWEWVEDKYDSKAYSEFTGKNPVNTTVGSYRVYRGGSWRYDAAYSRCALRVNDSPSYRYYNLGVRLARTR